ncbi:MAG: hypothetical protein PHI05_03880 [Bacilli bacterium]|nr:hypothetical protein [Bacilli bacterium]
MSKLNINEIKNSLALDLQLYIEIIKDEYKNFIPKERLEFLNSIKDFKDIIIIKNMGTISMFVRGNNIYFPASANKIINQMKFIPGFGINKHHKCFTKDTLIINDNTFIDYIKHVFIAGLSTKQFYLETLLHETMHFCGVGGSGALREGIAELKTRELAYKYNFTTSGCGYPKEIKIAIELQNIFGQTLMNKIAFAKNDYEITNIIRDNFGPSGANLYIKISRLMEKEFQDKYYKYKFPGITGPLKKAKKYNQLDYSEVYTVLYNYRQNDLEVMVKDNEKLPTNKDYLLKVKEALLSVDEDYQINQKKK